MTDRSIVAKLRADISDVTSKLKQVRTDVKGVADDTVKANDRIGKSSVKLADAEKIRAAVRARAAVEEVAASEKQVLAAQKYGKVTSLVSAHRDTLDKVGRGFTVVGLAAGVGLGAAVKSAADFDQSMSNIAATGSDARANLGALRAEAIKAGADTKYSATEAAGGIENLEKAGVSAKDILGGGLAGALNLAAAGGQDVADAAETAATALTQFKLTGADVPHVADLLAAGAGKAQGEVSDLSQALNQSGLVASQFGLSIDDTVGTLSAFASAGLLGSDAGTSFKTMLLQLANPSQQSRKQMDALGISAYDAQGKFVGITNLAGQLHDRLKSLPQAQRDAALAQIFGNDAVRAANVLYEQGSKGIGDWINRVNDQGYAATTAATKMDNLNGDLEQFRGSLETALIGAGSGATKGLREIVEAATQLVNSFNHLPEGAQHAAVIGTALVAAAGLGVGALIKVITTVSSAKTALTNLGASADNIGKFGRIAAGAAIGVGIYATAVQALLAAADEPAAVSNLEGATSALLAFSKAVPDAHSLDGLFQTLGSNGKITGLTGDVTDLGSALHTALSPALAQQIAGVGESIVTLGGSLGRTNADKVADQFKLLDESLSKLDPSKAAAAFQQITKVADQQGIGVDKLITLFPQYKAALEAQANALNVTGLSAQDYAGWMAGTVPPAIASAEAGQKAASGAQAAGAAADIAGGQFAVAGKQFTTAADALTAFFQESQGSIDASQALISYKDAADQAAAAAKKNGDTANRSNTALRTNSEKARDNASALNNLATQARSYISALEANNASTGKVTKATQTARDSFIAAARSMGLSKDAARKLADSYGLVPKDVKTTITAPGAVKAKSDADRLRSAVASIPPSKNVKITIQADTRGAAVARVAVASVHDRTVHITTVHSDGTRTSSKASAYAGGGGIWGRGTGTSDEIPIWASNGEYMQTAAAHTFYGTPAMDAMRSMQIPKEVFSDLGYAAGGPVGQTRFASGGQIVDLASVRQILAAVTDPIRDIATATKGLADAQNAFRAAQRAARQPIAIYNAAKRSNDRAVDARNELRTEHADETKREKDRIAVLERRAKATKGTTAADRELAAERAKLAKINRDYSADLAHANARVTATSKTKTAAEDAYKKAADRAKAASDKLKDAQSKLADANRALADSTKQISSSFYDAYSGSSAGGISDWLQQMKQGAADISAFQAKLDKLRGEGLNAALIDQLQAKGTIAGGDLADQLLQAGQGFIKQIDAAQVGLQGAADSIGLDVASAGKSSAKNVKHGSTVSAAAMAIANKAAVTPAGGSLMRPVMIGSPAVGGQPQVWHQQEVSITQTFPVTQDAQLAAARSADVIVARLSSVGV